MSFGSRVTFEPVRELAFGGIGAAYAAIGAVTVDYTRLVRFVNSTDVEVYISLDGSTNHIRIAAGSFLLLDFTSNEVGEVGFFVAKGTIFYTKSVAGAPSSGSVWIEVVYGHGGA